MAPKTFVFCFLFCSPVLSKLTEAISWFHFNWCYTDSQFDIPLEFVNGGCWISQSGGDHYSIQESITIPTYDKNPGKSCVSSIFLFFFVDVWNLYISMERNLLRQHKMYKSLNTCSMYFHMTFIARRFLPMNS